jgi:hypothetical protein
MSRFLLPAILVMTAFAAYGDLGSLFSPVPPPDELSQLYAISITKSQNPDSAMADVFRSIQPRWDLRPAIAVPLLKVTESTREGAECDAALLTSIGMGVSYQNLVWKRDSTHPAAGAWQSRVSFSFLVLVAGDTSNAEIPLDVSPAVTVGLLDNAFSIGFGYDLGEVGDRSRWFGIISTGLSFNN